MEVRAEATMRGEARNFILGVMVDRGIHLNREGCLC